MQNNYTDSRKKRKEKMDWQEEGEREVSLTKEKIPLDHQQVKDVKWKSSPRERREANDDQSGSDQKSYRKNESYTTVWGRKKEEPMKKKGRKGEKR